MLGDRNRHLSPLSISTLANGNPKAARKWSSFFSTTHHRYLPYPCHFLTLSPDKLMTDMLTQNTLTTSTTCCFLGWTSPSSSTFHNGTWIFSIIHSTWASHTPVRTSPCWWAQSRQFQLFKPHAPLDPFIQTNQIQSHLCLSMFSQSLSKSQALTSFNYSMMCQVSIHLVSQLKTQL